MVIIKYLGLLLAIGFGLTAIAQGKAKPAKKELTVFKLKPNTERIVTSSALVNRTLNQYFTQANLIHIPDKNDPKNLQKLLNDQIVYCQLTISQNGTITEINGGIFDAYLNNRLASRTKVFFENLVLRDSLGTISKIKKLKAVVR